MTHEEKVAKFQGVRVTLDGKPAQVVGLRLPFATVRTLDPDVPSYEWAWATAARIVDNGGSFRS